MPQANTTLSVCFTMGDFELNSTGLAEAIRAFWDNNPAVQLVKNAVSEVIRPIEDAVQLAKAAVGQVQEAFKFVQDLVDQLPFGRRLEVLTPADMVHAYELKDQAHRQLEQVRERLLHADNDNARDSIKERLQLDVYRRLEAHLAERKLAARQPPRAPPLPPSVPPSPSSPTPAAYPHDLTAVARIQSSEFRVRSSSRPPPPCASAWGATASSTGDYS